MIDLIEILFNQHTFTSRIYLTWDAASWHKSGLLVEWLDTFNVETSAFRAYYSSCSARDVFSVFGRNRGGVQRNEKSRGPSFGLSIRRGEMKTAISRHFVERNSYFRDNPKRAGNKIWEIDFFQDLENLNSGNYREW